jgi:hypothetical protein
MGTNWSRRLGLAGILTLVGWTSVGVGCAEERAPINQVQADALSKHFFVGASLSDLSDDPEFYMRNTVVDVPYGAAQDGLFTATYAQPLNRVKWEISETTLIARQTYEHIQNSDGNGSQRTNNGQVVAMFNIESHFDIRRSYNPQTGEETNIITENTTDRPWYQREYVRVDWSKNLVTDGYAVDTLSMLGILGGVTWDPESYYISDPSNPDAPLFQQDQGYFDVTTKAFATPQTITTPFGTFPACFLPSDYGGSSVYPVANCNATEVTLRLSFKVVPPTDYEPTDWNGNKMDAFGWFTQDRYGYDRNYGVLDDSWHHFASRYNIWDKSHIDGTQCAADSWRDANGNVQLYKTDGKGNYLTDPKSGLPIVAAANDPNGKPFTLSQIGANVHRDLNNNGTEDECEFFATNNSTQTLLHPGARCDEFSNKCAAPLYERNIKTIPWYYGPNSAPDLFPSTAQALNQWNIAVKRAATIGRMVEANRVGVQYGGEPLDGNSNPVYPSEQDLLNDQATGKPAIPEVFVLCHNPTIPADNPACMPGGKQVTARLGDIRYNIVNIIPTPQTPSPWGIMVDADDPLTGEKVATSVNEWGAVLDIAAQGTEDLLRWINGEITDQQIASGQYLKDWVTASKLGTAQYQPTTLTAQEIKTRLNSIDRSLANLNGLTASDMKNSPPQVRAAAAAATLGNRLGPPLDATFEGQRQAMIGTPWEVQLVTPEGLQAAGLDPSTPVASDPNALSQASPLRGMNPGLNRWIRHMRDVTMENQASCMIEQPEPDALVGMARQAARLYPLPNTSDANYPAEKFGRDQKLHQWIREQFHISVIAHEMGHSMGLRHNFTGSMDALNYHTEYWQLRTRNGQEHFCGYAGRFTDQIDATTPHTNGTDCVGPRWVDPITDTEVNGLVWKWGSSTVMDYPGDQTQDMNTIGFYDKAAMRFGYADVVDIEPDAKNSSRGPNINPSTGLGMDKGGSYTLVLDGFGGIGGQTIGGWHYSTYQDKFNPLGISAAQGCTQQSDPNDPLSATCPGPQLDFVMRRDMSSGEASSAGDVFKFGAAVATALPGQTVAKWAQVASPLPALQGKNGQVRHPYMFGSDEFADIGNVPVFRFDAGADSYEQFQFLISTYENRYIFDNFRRDRTTFSTNVQVHRAEDRYFDKIQGITKSLALLVGLGLDPSDPGSLLPLSLGASDGFAMFVRVLTRPEPGPFAIQVPSQTGLALNYAAAEDANGLIQKPLGDFQVALGSGEGRYLHNDYDYSQGYYWSDYQTQVGSYHEKVRAIYYLTEAYNRFVSNSKQDYIDGRYKNLNYSSLYPNQMRRLFAQLMQNDPMTLGPFVIPPKQVDPNHIVVHVQYMPWEKYDPNVASTVNLDYSAGAVVVDPLIGWEEQYPSLFNAFYYGATTLTMDWVDQMRIFSPGGGDTVSIPANQQIGYVDPATGLDYIARDYGYEVINTAYSTQVAKGSGARMLQYANMLAAQTYQVTATAPNGELTYAVDGNNNPICKVDSLTCQTNAATLRLYSANLDTVRQLGFAFGYGPGGHCDPESPTPCH